jgi:hypothetical protein
MIQNLALDGFWGVFGDSWAFGRQLRGQLCPRMLHDGRIWCQVGAIRCPRGDQGGQPGLILMSLGRFWDVVGDILEEFNIIFVSMFGVSDFNGF